MSKIHQDDEFSEYLDLIHNSLWTEQIKNTEMTEIKQFSPNSRLTNHSQRLKCFAEFSNSPELNEQNYYSNKSTSM